MGLERRYEATFRIPGQKEPWIETFDSNFELVKAAKKFPVGTKVRVWLEPGGVGYEVEIDQYHGLK